MVDNFFLQWSNVAFIIVDYCQYCRFKNNGLNIFSFNDNTDNGRQFFLCNGVMMLLLLLNIVNIVVLKNNWLYIFSLNDNTDNGRQFFCAIE